MIIALLGAYAVLYFAWLLGPLAGFGDRAVIASIALLPVRVAATGLAIAVARDRRLSDATRRAWLLLAVAVAFYTLGTAVVALAAAAGVVVPFPSVVDLLLLAFYPLAFLALLAFPAEPGAKADGWRVGFDVAIWVTGGGLVVWVLVFGSGGGPFDQNPLAAATTLGYPLGDLMLLGGVATATLRHSIRANRLPLTVLSIGLAALFVDDIAWTMLVKANAYHPGHPIDGLWSASTILIALAAVAQRSAAAQGSAAVAGSVPITGVGISLVPYAFLTAGYWALIVYVDPRLSESTIGLAIGSTALGVLVIGRQVVALRENGRLMRLEADRRSMARFDSIARNANDVLVVVRPDATIQYVSPSSSRVLDRHPGSLVDRPLGDLLWSDAANLLRSVPAGGAVSGVLDSVRHGDGRQLDVECTVADLRRDAEVRAFAITIRDISERRAYEGRLQHQAFHDGLTRLPNRLLLHDRVAHALARRRPTPGCIAILVVDLDDFKRVNGSLGHTAGDALLVEVAERLRQAVRAGDTVARLGGDEFAVLVEDAVASHVARACADRILETLAEPFDIHGHRIQLSASIGIALNGSPATADDLIRDADVAMHEAKASGKARHVEFEAAMHAVAQGRLSLEADIRAALERGEFGLHYQPIVDLSTGRVAGLEALVRWRHPVRGLILPNEFVPVAEASGLIVRLGHWILLEACRQLAVLHATGADRGLSVSVNLSVRQLASTNLAADVAAALETYELGPEHLILEVTESVMVQDQPGPIELLEAIRMTGVRIALDDFGTGYSSLAYLHRLPIDLLKIDKAFIDRLDGRDEDGALVAAIVQVGHALGMRVIAEGVEELAQRDRLAEMGCDFAQGFWFARPMDAADLMAVIGSRQRAQIVAA